MSRKLRCSSRLCLAAMMLGFSGLALAQGSIQTVIGIPEATALEATETADPGGERMPAQPSSMEPGVQATSEGYASFYSARFRGRRTASGERYDPTALTAAHRTLPFGTWVRVQSLPGGREVKVRINDRGPSVSGRVIDLSRAAAEALGMVRSGEQAVRIQVLKAP